MSLLPEAVNRFLTARVLPCTGKSFILIDFSRAMAKVRKEWKKEVERVKKMKEPGFLAMSMLFLLSVLMTASLATTVQAAEGRSAGEVIEHQVVEGDNLSLLAGYYYKDPRQWKKIYSLNSDAIDDPDVILPGTTVRIAADPSRQWDIPYRDYYSRVFD